MSLEVATSPRTGRSRRSWLLLVGLLAATWIWGATRTAPEPPEIPYTTAFTWIADGKVSEATLEGDVVRGKLRALLDRRLRDKR